MSKDIKFGVDLKKFTVSNKYDTYSVKDAIDEVMLEVPYILKVFKKKPRNYRNSFTLVYQNYLLIFYVHSIVYKLHD